MNKLIIFLYVISIVFGIFTGRISETVQAFLDGAEQAVLVVFGLSGVMCLWTGVLQVAEDAGIAEFLGRLISPVIGRLFPKLDSNSSARRYITMNICANLLGIANGATPMGIKAMQAMDEGSDTPTDEMCTFAVLNTAAITVIPTSVMALRMGAKVDVLVPIWITSVMTLLVALGVLRLMLFIRRRSG